MFGLLATACGGQGSTPEAIPFSDDGADTTTVSEPTATTPPPADTPVEPARTSAPADELRLGIIGGFEPDPALVSVVVPSEVIVADLLHDGLTTWDGLSGTWAHGLASDVTTSEDGRTWRFRLRTGATFSNGSPVEAADAARSIQRVIDGGGTAAAALADVRSVTAVGSDVVKFELGRPNASLPAVLASPVFGVLPGGNPDASVTSGPFVVSASTDEVVTLRPTGAAVTSVTAIHLHLSEDRADAVTNFEGGVVDLVVGAAGTGTDATEQRPAAVQVHYAINTQSAALESLEARVALAAALDADALTAEVFGPSATALGLTDPAATAGVDGKWPSDVGTIFVDYPESADPREAELAEAIVAQLQAAGIDAEDRAHSIDDLVSLVAAGEHHLVRTGWVGLAPDPQSRLAPYVSGGPENLAGLSDPAFDLLFNSARQSGDQETWSKAAAALDEAVAFVPIAKLTIPVYASDDVVGLQLRPDGTFPIETIAVRRG